MRERRPPDLLLVTIIIAVAFLTLGFANKARCLEGQFNARAYANHCYNDLQPLFGIRIFFDSDGDGAPEHVFPYINGERIEESNQLAGGAIEYPVLTGVFMYLSSLFVDNGDDYLRVSAILLAPFGIAIAVLLAKMSGWRALMWAAAPAIVFYAFHNWDLLVVAAAVAGIYMWSRGSPLWAAAFFGVGAAFKMYPIFFLGPLFLHRWTERDRRGAFAVAGVGIGSFALINLPFIIANFKGWIATYTFHSERGPNFDTMWCALKDMCLGADGWDPARLNTITLGVTALFFLAILGVGLLRQRSEGVFPFVQACGAIMAVFLLFNKVHSPQYTLWLLPFIVLIGHWIPALIGWTLYTLADAFVYWGIFKWFTDYNSQDFPTSELVMLTGIWMRAGLLLVLALYFLWARSSLPPPPEGSRDRTPVADPPLEPVGAASTP